MTVMTYAQALNEAHRIAMKDDPRRVTTTKVCIPQLDSPASHQGWLVFK